jgi:hypothetical protein
MENGVDPSFVIESLQGIEKDRNVLMEQRLQVQNSSVYIDITDNDVDNICDAVSDYLVSLKETLDSGGLQGKRDVLRWL